MKKVLITPRSFGSFSEEPFEILTKNNFEYVLNPYGRILTEEEMINHIKDADALIVGVDPVSREVLNSAPRLRIISKYGVGLDNIDLDEAKARGITVTTTSGANTEAVADYAFGLMLAVARKIVVIDRACRQLDWSKSTTLGLYGKTLGILGTGAIGKAVAKRASGFNMKILAYDIYKDEIYAGNNRIDYVELDELYQQSDFISLHLPLNDTTWGMINETAIDKMKKNAIIINTARGGLIDETALYKAIKQNRIWGAGLDVFEKEPPAGNPLLELDNVVIGSHCAASSTDAIDKMSLFSVHNIINAFNICQKETQTD